MVAIVLPYVCPTPGSSLAQQKYPASLYELFTHLHGAPEKCELAFWPIDFRNAGHDHSRKQAGASTTIGMPGCSRSSGRLHAPCNITPAFPIGPTL